MPDSAWCAECADIVVLDDDGACPEGHPRTSLRSTTGLDHPNESRHARRLLGEAQLDAALRGQRVIITAVLLNLATVVFEVLASLTPLGPAVILALVASVAGIAAGAIASYRMTSALGYRAPSRAVYVLLCMIPLVNIAALLVLGSSAAEAIQSASLKSRTATEDDVHA